MPFPIAPPIEPMLAKLAGELPRGAFLYEPKWDGFRAIVFRDGELDGMQYFDGEIEKLLRAGVISFSTAMLYATNSGNLRVQLSDFTPEDEESESMIIR